RRCWGRRFRACSKAQVARIGKHFAMIDLYTAPTPNDWKASVALEDLGLCARASIKYRKGDAS
ncbi:MAG: hypothetical protein AAFR33_06445, partial [Pseudomonadota bacterium]